VDEREEKSDEGDENAIAALEVEQAGVKGLEVAGEDIVRGDGALDGAIWPRWSAGRRDGRRGEGCVRGR
jgi:hypothetical protein